MYIRLGNFKPILMNDLYFRNKINQLKQNHSYENVLLILGLIEFFLLK